ncbi:MAG TPA: archaetidylserine decarboxylase [bacterium]|nr:archaetidylserine decarboxylase [bacterium]
MSSLLIRTCLFFLSFPGLSRFYGRLVRIERPRWLVRWVIRLFARRYRISMNDFTGEFGDYASLSAFFTRPLDPAKRPMPADDRHILAPADSVLSVCETVRDDRATQVKGRQYRLTGLVGEPFDLSRGWRVAVFYLSPHDYHRFHLPMAATVIAARRDGGSLYPVNLLSVSNIPDLFIRNERVTLKCETAGEVWYYVAVGATFVGAVSTVAGVIPTAGSWYPVGRELPQSAETGRFDMGSTIVTLIPVALAGEPLVAEGEKVRTGDRIWERRGG